MQVTAFSTPSEPRWRWRIVNYAGDVIEESREVFPTIAAAVAGGTKQLLQMDTDHSAESVHRRRSTSHLRRR